MILGVMVHDWVPGPCSVPTSATTRGPQYCPRPTVQLVWFEKEETFFPYCREHANSSTISRRARASNTWVTGLIAQVHLQACTCGAEMGWTCVRSDGTDLGIEAPHTSRLWRGGTDREAYEFYLRLHIAVPEPEVPF